MKIAIDQQTYDVTDEAIARAFEHLFFFTRDQYEKMPEQAKIAGMAGVRAWLWHAERAEKEPEKKKIWRPAKGADPTLHLVKVILGLIANELTSIQITIDTTEDKRVERIDITNTGESGGSIPANGNERVRKDDSSQDARQATSKALSIPPSLYIGLQT